MPLPLLAGLAIKAAPVKAFLSRIPRGVWIVLAVIAILGLGTCAHKRAVKKFGEERYAAGVKAEGDRIAKKAAQIKAKADALTGRISTELRNRNDEKVIVINRAADDLRLRGPGKAACPGNPGVSSSPGRSNPPAGQGSTPLAQVPSGERVDLIGLPFAGTVALAETCDLNRAEAASWREWHRQQTEAWKKISRQ